MNPRTNKISLFIGKRGTGKTDFIKEQIDYFPQPKCLIVDLFDNPVWHNMKTHAHPEWENREIKFLPPELVYRHSAGICLTYSSDIEALEQIVSNHVRNSVVIVEDASRWYNSKLTRSQKIYLLNSKQTNCDFNLFFHTLSSVPPELIKYADYLTLFKTGETTYDKHKYPIPGFDQVFQHVLNHPSKYENWTIEIN